MRACVCGEDGGKQMNPMWTVIHWFLFTAGGVNELIKILVEHMYNISTHEISFETVYT